MKPRGAVPDGGWGWMVVAGSTLIHFLIVGTGRCFGVFYLDLLHRFQQSAADTSWVIAIFNTVRMVFGPVAGMLCDRFTCRKVVLCGTVIVSAGFIISAFATSLHFIYISFGIVAGFGGSFLFTPSYVVVGKYFEKKKGRAMSLSTIGAGVGMFALAPLIQLLLDTYSFSGAMLIMGAIMLNNLVAGLLFRPLPPPPKEQPMQDLANRQPNLEVGAPDLENVESTQERTDSSHDTTSPEEDVRLKRSAVQSFWRTLRRQLIVMQSLTFLLYGFQIFCMSICIQTYLSFLPAIAEQYGSNRRNGSFLVSVLGISDVLGRLLWGFFFDLPKVRYRRRFFHTLLGFPLAIVAGIPGFLGSYGAFLGVTIVFGLLESGFHSQRATIVSEFVSKDQMSSTVGFVIFFQGFGNLAGPPIAGFIHDTFNSYNYCYFLAGGSLFLSSTIFLIEYCMRRVLRKEQSVDNPIPS